MTDARKTLPMLAHEWAGCTKCDLSTHRDANNGQIVFGEGRQRGILFIGEGPGRDEEAYGRPFIGKSGQLLRRFLDHYRIKNYYITNVVACRSCAPRLDGAGNVMFSRGFNNSPPRVKYQDQPPTKEQTAACAPRVYEEIYMADPVLIVALGGEAASFLKGSSVKITQSRGAPMEIEIPGAGRRAVLSEKKREWLRKIKGEWVQPVTQSTVRYMMVPTLHPSFVLRNQHDENSDNAFLQFAKDIVTAKNIYNRYHIEVTGIVPDDYEEEAEPLEVPAGILEDLQDQDG